MVKLSKEFENFCYLCDECLSLVKPDQQFYCQRIYDPLKDELTAKDARILELEERFAKLESVFHNTYTASLKMERQLAEYEKVLQFYGTKYHIYNADYDDAEDIYWDEEDRFFYFGEQAKEVLEKYRGE